MGVCCCTVLLKSMALCSFFSYLGSSNKVVPGHFTCIALQLSGVYNDSGPCSHIPGDGDAPGLVFPPRGSDLNPVVVIKTCKSDQ